MDRKSARDPELVAFGAGVRSLRDRAGMTQQELAHTAGLHWTLG